MVRGDVAWKRRLEGQWPRRVYIPEEEEGKWKMARHQDLRASSEPILDIGSTGG